MQQIFSLQIGRTYLLHVLQLWLELFEKQFLVLKFGNFKSYEFYTLVNFLLGRLLLLILSGEWVWEIKGLGIVWKVFIQKQLLFEKGCLL